MTTSTEVLEVAASIEEMLPAVAAVLREYAELLKGGGIVDKKPVEAIERMRNDWRGNTLRSCEEDCRTIIEWADSIPEGSVPVVWPKELTREHILRLCADFTELVDGPTMNAIRALRALAAISPVRKKRVVNLWECPGDRVPTAFPVEFTPSADNGWKPVARNVELED